MPEGDTIHHAAARIRAVLTDRVPEQILTPHRRHQGLHWPRELAGRSVRSVDAYGKHLLLRFEGDLSLHSHLRMTGLWGVYGDGERWARSRSRAWLALCAGGWEVVQFDGPVLELLTESRLRRRLALLGQDVLGESFEVERFLRRLRGDDPARPIGDALLDQRTVAGIGNLWKAESCFAARVDPWRPLAEVSDGEALAVVGFAREQMQRSARDGFSARPRAVYGRSGRPCRRCGSIIRQRGQWENNRLTFWCPGCQG